MECIEPLARVTARETAPFVRLVHGFVAPAQCDAIRDRIIAMQPEAAPVTTSSGPVVRPEIRNNERVMFDDEALATALFERAIPLLPRTLRGHREPRSTLDAGDFWSACGLNERFRGYRYRPGQRFAPHYDGFFRRSADEVSALTFIVYLDEGCTGGETILDAFGVVVKPRRGSLFVFDHRILHQGAEVRAGTKHVLRSDVMYRRATAESA